jgi:uncharacterized protein YfiM (DUF2279 family)
MRSLPARRLAAFALLACLALPPGPARASILLPREEEGSWLAADHELHFAASLGMAASLRVEGRDRGSTLALTVGIGLLKEAYDATLKPRRIGVRGGSRRDLVADLLGAAAGVFLIEAIDR